MSSTPDTPKTAAEYKAAFAELLAEITRINEHMNRNRPEIERLKRETAAIAARTDAKLAAIGEHLQRIEERQRAREIALEQETRMLREEQARLRRERGLPPRKPGDDLLYG